MFRVDIAKSHSENVHQSRNSQSSVSTQWNIFLKLLASLPYCLLSIGASCRVVREMSVSISWWSGGRRGQCGRSTRGRRREARWLSGKRTTPSSERSMTPGEWTLQKMFETKSTRNTIPDTRRWLNGWTMWRWPYPRCVQARCTHLQSSRERRITFNHFART